MGSSSLITNLDGDIVQHIEYVPFGEVFLEERNNKWNTLFLFNAKELDEETGLYYYGARYYDPRTSVWISTDPLQEKYPNISTYAYCALNPVKFIDPDGKDWFKDKNGTIQYDPKIKESSKLQEKQSYVGVTHQVKDKNGNVTENYRKDGSIMFSNETSAYKRMWSQAIDHYKGQKEAGGVVLENGKVLVTPDYKNEKRDCSPSKYGYSVSKDGYISKDGEKFKITGQIHTHQDPTGDATPSFYTGNGWGDVGFSQAMGGLPIMTIGHDGQVYGAFYSEKQKGYGDIGNLGSRLNLLSGKTKLAPWLKTYPTKGQ